MNPGSLADVKIFGKDKITRAIKGLKFCVYLVGYFGVVAAGSPAELSAFINADKAHLAAA